MRGMRTKRVRTRTPPPHCACVASCALGLRDDWRTDLTIARGPETPRPIGTALWAPLRQSQATFVSDTIATQHDTARRRRHRVASYRPVAPPRLGQRLAGLPKGTGATQPTVHRGFDASARAPCRPTQEPLPRIGAVSRDRRCMWHGGCNAPPPTHLVATAAHRIARRPVAPSRQLHISTQWYTHNLPKCSMCFVPHVVEWFRAQSNATRPTAQSRVHGCVLQGLKLRSAVHPPPDDARGRRVCVCSPPPHCRTPSGTREV